jgi:DNA-binding transcriptional MocR family regulator
MFREGGQAGAPMNVSMRTRVERYVRLYQEQHNGWSPSLGKISEDLGTTKTTVTRAIERLERDGRLVRLPAKPQRPRPIVFPDAQARAVELLQGLGWKLGAPQPSLSPVTVRQLPVVALLGQIDAADEGLRHGGSFGENQA